MLPPKLQLDVGTRDLPDAGPMNREIRASKPRFSVKSLSLGVKIVLSAGHFVMHSFVFIHIPASIAQFQIFISSRQD